MTKKLTTKKRKTQQPRINGRLLAEMQHRALSTKESEDVINAIRHGKIDALVMDGAEGTQVLTLQNSEHPYRVLMEKVSDGAATLDSEGIVLYANSRFMEILGIPSDHFVGTSLQSHLVLADQKILADLIPEGLLRSVQGKITRLSSSGRERFVRLALHPIKNSVGNNICVVATEITELVEANDALKANEESLRQLSARLLKLQDEERRHIARDLHDITGQKLAVQSMILAQVAKARPGLDPDSQHMLAECVALNKQIGEEVRTLSYILHPPLLDELGLLSAVKWYAEGFEHKTRIQLDVDMEDLERLPPHVEVTLFRIIQESLTNVHRYSESPRGFVRVKTREDEIQVQVGDFGKGMSQEKLSRAAGSGAPLGVGIQGMKERMRQLGGNLEIDSRVGKGTVVTATLRLSTIEKNKFPESTPAPNESTSSSPSEPVVSEQGQKKILIVDDHEMLRRGIRTAVEHESGLQVCGEATNGQEAVDQARALRPDLVILDINLPVLNGIAVIRQIVKYLPRTRIVVFTVHESDQTAKEVRAAGAHGYVSKGKGGEDLLRVIKNLLENDAALANAIS